MSDRKDVLLKAAYDILKKCDEANKVIEVLHQTASYDGTECDGFCLMNDIADELDLPHD